MLHEMVYMSDITAIRTLDPLKYHRDLVDYLKSAEPHVWQWARSDQARNEQVSELRDMLLRQTYRLEPSSHPTVFEAARAAMASLQIDAPLTLYQANDGSMNASAFYVRGEIHLVFYGPVLERLSERELLALMGHELAHYKLWSAEDEAFYSASRILDNALSYPEATLSHRETARLLSLNTELYADRGATLAAGEVGPAISVLVKVMTGMNAVDPDAYLRQAEELEASARKSEGFSHPETFLRARALDLWWKSDPRLESWIDTSLLGPISIEGLDLMRQRELTQMTQGFFARFLRDIRVDSPHVLTQIRSYFPAFQPTDPPLDLARISGDRIDDATRGYFVALMLDCAMADPEARDTVMQSVAKISREIGAADKLKTMLRQDLKWTKIQIDRVVAQSQKAA